MIVFVTTTAHAYTVRDWLEHHRTRLHGRLMLMTYRELLAWPCLAIAHYVLADVDRLDEPDRDRVAARIDELKKALPPQACVLNHPRHSLRRAELLASLHVDGFNDFKVIEAEADSSGLRYPVFVRSSVEHNGNLTPLLTDATALNQALTALRQQRGGSLHDCLIVEFVDVRNERGLFEKYGAFRIGDRIFASDFSVDGHWVCKGEVASGGAESERAEWVKKDLDFQRRNPDEALLRPIFERARIDYGRIDYAFSNGRLQVFEINTNPMRSAPAETPPVWRASMECSAGNWITALLALPTLEKAGHWKKIGGANAPDCIDESTATRRLLRRLLRSTGLLHRELGLYQLRNSLNLRRS